MKPDKNKELMMACGSSNGAYDVEAPDQWRFVLLHVRDPHEKAMAWVKSKTTAYLHESPFCVDEHGNWVFAEHMAVDLGWKRQTARNVLGDLRSQGRIRLDDSVQNGKKGKRIWYCADVPMARQASTDDPYDAEDPDEEEPEDHADPTSNGGCRNSVHSCGLTYVVDFIKKLSPKNRAEAKRKVDACAEWRREFMADGMAALRVIADRVEDTTLLEIGVPKKRLEKRRETKVKWVQLSLLAEPNFVQSCVTDFVQSADSTSYKPKSDPVQSGVSFMGSAATATTATLSAASSSSTLIDKGPEPKPVESQKLTTTNPPESPSPQKYATDRDELVALIQKNTGRLPDQKLVRDIAEKVELRGFTLRLFLDDIGPRVLRLTKPPGEGFFISHAGKFGGVETTLVPEPETIEQKAERTGPCKKCHGIGTVFGVYCDCRMGRDLERVEKRRKEGEQASHA